MKVDNKKRVEILVDCIEEVSGGRIEVVNIPTNVPVRYASSIKRKSGVSRQFSPYREKNDKLIKYRGRYFAVAICDNTFEGIEKYKKQSLDGFVKIFSVSKFGKKGMKFSKLVRIPFEEIDIKQIVLSSDKRKSEKVIAEDIIDHLDRYSINKPVNLLNQESTTLTYSARKRYVSFHETGHRAAPKAEINCSAFSNESGALGIVDMSNYVGITVGDAPIETENKGYIVYPLLYGTNRERVKQKRKNIFPYGTKRGEELQFGTCNISIPKPNHREGRLERPLFFLPESPKKHFTMLDYAEISEEQLINYLKEKFADSTEKDVLLFVHGYNTTFKSAMYRTAQLGYDLCFNGLVTAFSWPSTGSLLGYLTDFKNAEVSGKHLRQYIKLILESQSINKIHIIAHSMGNVVLCDALERLREDGLYPSPIFNQIILAAPDIDREKFITQILPKIKKSPNITMYASNKDKALLASKKVGGNAVLGEGGENLVVVDGLYSIDASEVNTDIMGHNYFTSTLPLLNDIHYVLVNVEPNKRKLDRLCTIEKQPYWRLRKD